MKWDLMDFLWEGNDNIMLITLPDVNYGRKEVLIDKILHFFLALQYLLTI